VNTTYCLRWLYGAKLTREISLSKTELDNRGWRWLNVIQKYDFPEEYSALSERDPVSRRSPLSALQSFLSLIDWFVLAIDWLILQWIILRSIWFFWPGMLNENYNRCFEPRRSFMRDAAASWTKGELTELLFLLQLLTLENYGRLELSQLSIIFVASLEIRCWRETIFIHFFRKWKKCIKSCLNSRSLYPTSNDLLDLTVITPGHFLIDESLIGFQSLLKMKKSRPGTACSILS